MHPIQKDNSDLTGGFRGDNLQGSQNKMQQAMFSPGNKFNAPKQIQAGPTRPPIAGSKPDPVLSPKLIFEDPGDRDRPVPKKKVSIFGDDGPNIKFGGNDYASKAALVEKALDDIDFKFSSGKKEKDNNPVNGQFLDSTGQGSSLRSTANSSNPLMMNQNFGIQPQAYPPKSGSRLPPQAESERELPRPISNPQSFLQSAKQQNLMSQPDQLPQNQRFGNMGSNNQFQERFGQRGSATQNSQPNLNIYQQGPGAQSMGGQLAQRPQTGGNFQQQQQVMGNSQRQPQGFGDSSPAVGFQPPAPGYGGMQTPNQLYSRSGQFQTPLSDSGLNNNGMSGVNMSRVDRELQDLRTACMRKEQELKTLQMIASGQTALGSVGQGGVSRELLERCVQSAKELKRQEAEIRDLRYNYTVLKEETEKQEGELRRAEDSEGIDRVPRSREELVKQNGLLREKISRINKEYEKTVYDKTLEIEKKARTKMHKIALQIAREQANPEDREMRELIARATELEKEYERLEREHNPSEMSFVGIAN